jgi:uncharacterized membrane protein YoaK (UPF0700 family)
MPHVARLSLATGSVLMVATGFVDAYTFLQHGHVFAQAMTGNLVLIAIGTFDPTIVAFWRPLVSYLAFVVGVVVVWRWSRDQDAHGRVPGPQLATLGLQVVVLVVVGFLHGGALSVVISALISFTAGMQIAAFRGVGRAAFTTTVMTTNSMKTVNAALTAVTSADPDARAEAGSFGTALAGFVAGAFLGAFLSTRIADRAAWVDAALFALAAGLYVAERGRGAGAAADPEQ